MSLLGKTSGGPTVGIDIGSSLIKVVEAKPGNNGIQITALGIAPTPPGVIDNEMIVDPLALGQAIRQLLQESGISCRRSVSSVSGQSSVVVRIIEVPKMTEKELADTMKWEVERHVPFSANEAIIDFQPMVRSTASPDDQNMEVLLAVARQEVVNSHVEALVAANLSPAAIEVESVASPRSLIGFSGNPDEIVAIINIGALTTELAVYQGDMLALPRTLPLAGDSITRSLADALSITMEEAERLKREEAEILADRLQSLSSMSMGPMGGYDDGNATMGVGMGMTGFGTPDEPSNDLSFFPGLGYGDVDSAPQSSTPDFDLDVSGGSGNMGLNMMNFDMDMDAPKSGPSEPANTFDLSGGSYDDAPKPVATGQAAEFTKEQIFDAMAPVLMDLVSEIRRSIEYYSSKFQNQPGRILLCGGTAKMKGLDELLKLEMGIPVELANPLRNVTVLSRNLSQDYLEEVASVFPVSIGLAIRDMIGG